MLSYGLKEALDAEIVLREAYKYIDIQKLTIWGRSMGAATAIMFANRNPKIIDKIVLDGAFRKLSSVVKRVIQNQSHLP